MSLFENMSMDDYNKLQARYQQKQAQNTAQNLANRQAALNAAQKKSQGGLVDTLVGLATGIKDKVVDAGATLNNMGKTVVGGIDEIFANKANKDAMADDSKRRNDIAKKYGYNSYSDALNDDNASQDFWNEIKESNKTTQNKLKDTRKTYDKSYGNVQDVNLNKAAGQALNTIDTVGMALGGGAGVAANILGGGLASIGDQYKADAEAGKKDLNWGNFNLKNAATGLAGGAAGSLAGGALGKAASKAGNPLTKALTSQLGQGIGSGAAAGAAGGLAGTLANGGSIEDALANALQGAKGGALGGGVMAGTMGLAGKGLNKLKNGKTTAVNAEPVDAQVVAKNKIAQPQTKAIEAEIVEPVNNRRGIAIKDYNAGIENIPVNRSGQLKSNANKPTYYEYQPIESNAPVVVDGNGNFAVNDGISTRQTKNGRITTYDGGGEWNGARVFNTDGDGLPNGFKIIADENAAPNNNYVAIVNDAGEKALIELPHSSDYDYERVGLATGTTRESLADKGLIQDLATLKVNEPKVTARNGRKYIDSVVRRADANLPEAGKTASDILYDTTGGKYKDATHFIGGNTAADNGGYFGGYANDAIADIFPKDIVEALRKEAQATHTNTVFAPYGMNSRQDLPMLNRQEYYSDRTGRPGYQGLRAEDIPAYMQDRMRNDAGKSRYASSDNESIMREVFGNNMDKEQMYDLYEQLAQTTTDPKIYSDENLAAALATDPELNRRATQILADQTKKQINVQGGPAISDTIPVTDRTTRYTESTLPARTYETPTARAKKVMNAEPTPTKAMPTTTAVADGQATGWGEKDMTNSVKKRNALQKLGDSLQETGQATKDGQVYAKLKGNTAEEMARKNAVQRLRELGFKPSDYKNAANMSEVANKWYADQVAQTKTPIEAPQLRNIATEVADDLRLTMQNRADLEKLVNGMLDDAVAKDGKMSNYSLDRYTPAELEKVAKAIGVKEQNITTTNMGGSKKANRNLTPENEQYANALREVRNRLRNEIGEMADYNEAELVARLKKAGATQKQIDYVTQDHTLKGVKARTSLFEDARTMEQQMRSDALKRGANTSKSTDIATQVANEVGVSGLAREVAKPVASLVGGIEKGAGKIISGIGNAMAGDNEALKGAAGKAGQALGAAGKKIGNATADLNNTTAANIAIGGTTLGDIAQKMANRTIAQNQAEYAQNRAETAKAQQAVEDATNQYNTAQTLANNAMAATQQSAGTGATLDRIARAMDLAMQAGDMNAYGQLADLYKQAYSIYELQNPTSTKNAKALSANQSKALTGLQQLETLKGMQSGVRTALADSPLGGLIDLTGGDEYSNQAKSLALTLGYLQSGANITPREAEKIGKAYIPTAFDSEEVRNGKLARAEQLLRDYLADTTALQQ